MTIRRFIENDWAQVWQIIEPVFRAGETYPMSPEITEADARHHWIETPKATYVAVSDADEVTGTYYIKPNSAALGAHVCNCGYIVSSKARRQGIATALCEHSQQEAVAQGYRCMQYNLVVSTNEASVNLWKKMGFQVVGTLPGAFRHPRLGYVDALVMYKQLLG